MNVITVTREYGAGGYEVARRLAETLGWELLDRELLHRAAALEHLPDAELERLDEKAVSLADRFRLHPPHQHYLHGLQQAAQQAAGKGNVVLVGRGTGHLLAGLPQVFHLRLAAPREWRAHRMADQEGWTFEEALARCAAEDRNRDRFTRYFFGEAPFAAAAYHAVFNTGRVPLEDVAACVAAVVRNEKPPSPPTPLPRGERGERGRPTPLPLGERGEEGRPTSLPLRERGEEGPPTPLPQEEREKEVNPPAARPRVLTLARELGAGERSIAAAPAGRQGLRVYDRELLEQEAVRLGITPAELEPVDERPAGLFHRFRPGKLHQRYFDALGRLMNELAAQGDVLLVGRGGSRFLRDHPRAFHVRVVAPELERVRRVMEHHWVREAVARPLIAESDSRRRGFYADCFGADWADPLEYHLTANTGLLGPAAGDLVAFAAGRHWGGGPT